MTGRPKKDIAASVRQRLLNKARETGRPFNEVLQYFAMERFLYRLSISPHADRFVLKGALMLAVWRAPVSRPTMDIDLLGRLSNDIGHILVVVRSVCLQSVESEGLTFDETSVEGERIVEGADDEGVRVRLRASLGTARMLLRLDIGFGDVIVPSAFPVDFPTILDMPPPQLSGYSRESAVAEQFEAMTKLGMLNSRMKDFFDLWLLSREFSFDGHNLAEAIAQTFSNRGTAIQSAPAALTNSFFEDVVKCAQWRSFVRRSRLVHAPHNLGEVITAVSTFLGPVTAALAAGLAFDGTWLPPGPWSGSHLGSRSEDQGIR